jgi:hypothetical protein
MGRCNTCTSIAGALLAISTLAACADDDDDAGADSALDAAAEDFVAVSATEEAAAPATTGAPQEAAGGPVSTPIDLGAVGADVIIEMHVVLGSDDIERAVASIGASAASLGGGIASSDIDYPSATTGATGHAVLVVKVPPAGVNGLLDGLNATGTVQSIDQIAQDVSDQLVDLEVRIANARQSVSNVRQFMEQTQNLNELVTLESELTRRQTELEQLEAQQRNLRDRVAFSTITIEVVPLASLPELESDDDMSIGEAFESGWDAFAATFVAIAFVLAVLAPFAAVALVFGLVAWRVSRRFDRPNRPRTHHDVRRELEDADQRDRDRERQPVGVSTQSDDEPSG